MLQAIFCPTGVSSLLWSTLLPLLFQDRAVHTRPRGPASALFIRGWAGPERRTPSLEFCQAVSSGPATWRGKVKKSQRGAFRISGLSFGASVDRQVGPLAVARRARSCSGGFWACYHLRCCVPTGPEHLGAKVD